jgi:hypothetical protein
MWDDQGNWDNSIPLCPCLDCRQMVQQWCHLYGWTVSTMERLTGFTRDLEHRCYWQRITKEV